MVVMQHLGGLVSGLNVLWRSSWVLEAVTHASWLVHTIKEPLCNQSVVETWLLGQWAMACSHTTSYISIRNMRYLHQIYHCLWGKMLVPYSCDTWNYKNCFVLYTCNCSHLLHKWLSMHIYIPTDINYYLKILYRHVLTKRNCQLNETCQVNRITIHCFPCLFYLTHFTTYMLLFIYFSWTYIFNFFISLLACKPMCFYCQLPLAGC